MQRHPLVTVVTVTFNSSAFVRNAIESVLASSYNSWELVIGDDSSTDDTWEIIQSYHDPRIVAYRNEINLGEYKNRNKAIDRATGEYLLFIDGDDMIYGHGLELMIRLVEEHPDCGMALMYPYVKWMFLPVVVSPREFYLSNFFHKGFNDVAFANTLFRTEILRGFSGLPLIYSGGDTFIRLRIASKHPVLLIPDQLTWWRETPGQASERMGNNPLSVMENLKLHEEILFANENPLSAPERKSAFENELFKVKLIFVRYLKQFRLARVVGLLGVVLKHHLTNRVLFARRTRLNPFGAFSPVNPLSCAPYINAEKHSKS